MAWRKPRGYTQQTQTTFSSSFPIKCNPNSCSILWPYDRDVFPIILLFNTLWPKNVYKTPSLLFTTRILGLYKLCTVLFNEVLSNARTIQRWTTHYKFQIECGRNRRKSLCGITPTFSKRTKDLLFKIRNTNFPYSDQQCSPLQCDIRQGQSTNRRASPQNDTAPLVW